tara:strand:- start:614 stop:1612 length:999 start_codon:yes stop_codon:yes gene_type:complete
MIKKSFEFNKIDNNQKNFFLFYGKNEELKVQATNYLINKNTIFFSYEEKEILDNKENFLENMLTKSLFEQEKVIIIKRATDKILKIIEELSVKNIHDISLIINADTLEKKSKLRNFFEKHKKFICIAFYPDNEQTLNKLTLDILKSKKISISQENINFLVQRCNGDRKALLNELNKIEYFSKNGKKISEENLKKITNLFENHSISELIDNCLAKNKKKTIHILNENNFTPEDSILIVRTLLNKSKKLLKLADEYEINKNIELTISSAKPPIFWKDKEITKRQIEKWEKDKIKNLIYKINELELIIKKNLSISMNIIINFILEQLFSKTNSET